MFGCARCGAVNDSPSKPCHRCGWDPTRTRTNDVHSSPVPKATRSTSADGQPAGATALLAEVGWAEPATKGRTAKAHPPITGLYEPPRYAPTPSTTSDAAVPAAPKGRRVATTPSGKSIPEPVKVPVTILLVIAVLLAGLGGTAFLYHRSSTAADRGALGAGVPGSWAPWAEPSGVYLASFPGRPVYDTRPATTDAAGGPILTSDAFVDHGTVSYRVTMTTLPASTRDAITDADLLAGAVGGLRMERPGLDVATGPVETWSGLASVAFEGTLPSADGHPHGVHGRAAVHGSRVFVLLVTERGPLANTDKFLGSFQLVA